MKDLDYNPNDCFDDIANDEILDDEYIVYCESRHAPQKVHNLEPPRRREMNDDSRDDFVAIDFETMTPLRTSACSVGMVKVLDGEIAQQFYSLINPIRDEYTDKEPNLRIHGISLREAEKALTFEDMFDLIRGFIGNYPLVCHGRGADIAIIEQLMDYYGLSGIDTSTSICTYAMTGKSLAKCCDEYGIHLENHHNALSDAEACARVYLELIGKPLINKNSTPFFTKSAYSGNRQINKEHRGQLDDSKIINKDTLFYNATVVITGTFPEYPERDELAAKIQSLGARIVSSISKRTTHVVVGDGAGPKKIEKIQTLNEQGCNIVIIRPHELAKIFE